MGVWHADMHGRKLIYDRQNLVHTKQSQLHLRGACAGVEASILCCTTGGGWWDTIASSAGEFGPVSTVAHEGQNPVHTERSQLHLRGRGGGASILYWGPCRGPFSAKGGGWRVIITNSAGKFDPVSAAANGDGRNPARHTEQSQLPVCVAGGVAAIRGLLIATGGGWQSVITSSAEKCGPVSAVSHSDAARIHCRAKSHLDGVRFAAADGSVIVECLSTLSFCNWGTSPVEVVIVINCTTNRVRGFVARFPTRNSSFTCTSRCGDRAKGNNCTLAI